jgi:DNA-directed RNA polymerase subunit RPC12/RpoP
MRINCLSCGHRIELDDDVYSDYEGPVRCMTCRKLNEVRTESGKLRALRMPRPMTSGHTVGALFENIQEAALADNLRH